MAIVEILGYTGVTTPEEAFGTILLHYDATDHTTISGSVITSKTDTITGTISNMSVGFDDYGMPCLKSTNADGNESIIDNNFSSATSYPTNGQLDSRTIIFIGRAIDTGSNFDRTVICGTTANQTQSLIRKDTTPDAISVGTTGQSGTASISGDAGAFNMFSFYSKNGVAKNNTSSYGIWQNKTKLSTQHNNANPMGYLETGRFGMSDSIARGLARNFYEMIVTDSVVTTAQLTDFYDNYVALKYANQILNYT